MQHSIILYIRGRCLKKGSAMFALQEDISIIISRYRNGHVKFIAHRTFPPHLIFANTSWNLA